MNPLFQTIRVKKPKRNLFDLSHEKKMSLNMGDLVPMFVQDVVPGDKFQVSSEALVRISPLIAPLMHRINVYIHYFYVPNRLVWDNWQEFITGGVTGLGAPAFPTFKIVDADKSNFYKGKLPDYMGVPVTEAGKTVVNELTVSALPFRAYHLIYNEYYRDENLQTPVDIKKTDVPTGTERNMLIMMRKRCWEKDYFTSALPWTQRGADVVLPNDPVYKDVSEVIDDNTDLPAAGGQLTSASDGGLAHSVTGYARIENIEGIDISINDLRRSIKLQEWLEKNARAGSRYIEQILAHFGVTSSDARLQRPEYLGGGRVPLVVSEVLNTSDTATRPQGSMAGHGIAVGSSNRFKKYFEEHGYVLGIMSVLPRTAYQQGVEKHLIKFDKYDFYWPEFANLGEQPVKNQELFHQYDGTPSQPNGGTFGYQSRYSEYKFKNSTVHGDFKDTLSFWHMGRIFSSQPALNSAFVQSDPTHRVFPVTDANVHKLYVQLYNNVRALRPMPVFGSPLL